MNAIRKPRLGLSLLVLTVLLSGCGIECPPCRPLSPPAVYLQHVREPEFRGRTNGDLLAWALELREALRLANHDKEKLQSWAGRLDVEDQ